MVIRNKNHKKRRLFKEHAKVARLPQEAGVPFDKIAPQVRDGVSVPTLVKYFRDELVPATPGQKPFVPTADKRKLVETLEAKGLRYVDMASVLRGGINPCMLWRHCRTEIRSARRWRTSRSPIRSIRRSRSIPAF